MDHDVLSSIAIIGLSVQFPQASSPEAFWELMMSGRRTATRFPPDRLCDGKYHRVNHSSRNSVGNTLHSEFRIANDATLD